MLKVKFDSHLLNLPQLMELETIFFCLYDAVMVARSRGLVCGRSLKGTKGLNLVIGVVGREEEASATGLSLVHRRAT
jgi:hypothetical protein